MRARKPPQAVEQEQEAEKEEAEEGSEQDYDEEEEEEDMDDDDEEEEEEEIVKEKPRQRANVKNVSSVSTVPSAPATMVTRKRKATSIVKAPATKRKAAVATVTSRSNTSQTKGKSLYDAVMSGKTALKVCMVYC